MLSINTNLSSLLAQSSMQSSTNILNQAVERMTTGYKINHAKDNAANYSIATNMTTKIGALQVAEDNVMQGFDLLNTANESLNLIEDKLNRLRTLAVQACNGTYGESSQLAISKESKALVDEINRIYSTTEYNNISLFVAESPPDNTFTIEKAIPQEIEVEELKRVKNQTSFLSGETYYISTKEDLVKLAELVNSGKGTSNVTFEVTANIDMEGVAFEPIGKNSTSFTGVLDGNGYEISNLTINSSESNVGLIAVNQYGVIKDLGLVDVNITGGSNVGAFAGFNRGDIINCYSTGKVEAITSSVGGIVGFCTWQQALVENCYTSANVKGTEKVGGLVGSIHTGGKVINSYATGSVTGGGDFVGGLIGYSTDNNIIENCYTTGNVQNSSGGCTGGLIGYAHGSTKINNCFALGDVNGVSNTGGLIGFLTNGSSVVNSYSKGDIEGKDNIGGFVGAANNSSNISSSYALGKVEATNSNVGGFIGSLQHSAVINDSYSKGTVFSVGNSVGGFCGSINYSASINRCFSNGSVEGASSVGGFVGYLYQLIDVSNCYTTSNVIGSSNFGAFGGVCVNDNITGSKNAYNIEQGLKAFGTIRGAINAEGKLIEELESTETLEVLGFSELNGWILQSKGGPMQTTFYELPPALTFQIGISASESSNLEMSLSFSLQGISSLKAGSFSVDDILLIDNILTGISAKQTELGAVQNRLESARDEISTQYENLASSRSTIRDADISEVSATYIQQQILQQAAATLMSTANQSPAIALQLI